MRFSYFWNKISKLRTVFINVMGHIGGALTNDVMAPCPSIVGCNIFHTMFVSLYMKIKHKLGSVTLLRAEFLLEKSLQVKKSYRGQL